MWEKVVAMVMYIDSMITHLLYSDYNISAWNSGLLSGLQFNPPSPGPREIPGCFGGQCQLTYCPACYYAKEPRPLPGNCPDCGSPVTSLTCLRNWAACIRIADMWQYGSVSLTRSIFELLIHSWFDRMPEKMNATQNCTLITTN